MYVVYKHLHKHNFSHNYFSWKLPALAAKYYTRQKKQSKFMIFMIKIKSSSKFMISFCYFLKSAKKSKVVGIYESYSLVLLDLFISSDASIWSTMAFPPLGNSDHVVVSVFSLTFHQTHNGMLQFIT